MRYMGRLGLNLEALLKIIALLGFAILFHTVIESGNAQYYVHPRIIPYMKFGIAAFVLVSIFVSGELLKPKRKNVRIMRYLIFIIPLILAFMLPPKTLDTDSMSLRTMNAIARTDEETKGQEKDEDIQSYSVEEELMETTKAEENQGTTQNAGDINSILLIHGDTIIMDDESFAPWLAELYGNLARYEGRRIQVVGFVFKDKEFSKNEFVPARFAMNCCAADMQPVGILCAYKGAAQLKKDSWVKVTGKVQQGEFKGEKMPVIMAETVEAASKPKNEFVYPY